MEEEKLIVNIVLENVRELLVEVKDGGLVKKELI